MVDNCSAANVVNRIADLLYGETKVYVFGIHEVLLIEKSHLLEYTSFEHYAGTCKNVDVDGATFVIKYRVYPPNLPIGERAN